MDEREWGGGIHIYTGKKGWGGRMKEGPGGRGIEGDMGGVGRRNEGEDVTGSGERNKERMYAEETKNGRGGKEGRVGWRETWGGGRMEEQ